MPNVFSHPYQVDESISNFRVVGGILHFYSFKRNFCKQTVENPIRRRVLRRFIWFCTVLPMSHKKECRLIWVKQTLYDIEKVGLKQIVGQIYPNELQIRHIPLTETPFLTWTGP